MASACVKLCHDLYKKKIMYFDIVAINILKIVWNIDLAWDHLIAHISGHHLVRSFWNSGVCLSSILVVCGWQVHISGIQFDYV